MKRRNFRSLDLDKIKARKSHHLTTAEALKDVVPIEWGKNVLDGDKKITITGVK